MFRKLLDEAETETTSERFLRGVQRNEIEKRTGTCSTGNDPSAHKV